MPTNTIPKTMNAKALPRKRRGFCQKALISWSSQLFTDEGSVHFYDKSSSQTSINAPTHCKG